MARLVLPDPLVLWAPMAHLVHPVLMVPRGLLVRQVLLVWQVRRVLLGQLVLQGPTCRLLQLPVSAMCQR